MSVQLIDVNRHFILSTKKAAPPTHLPNVAKVARKWPVAQAPLKPDLDDFFSEPLLGIRDRGKYRLNAPSHYPILAFEMDILEQFARNFVWEQRSGS